jgi:hypothetical protein
VLSRIPLLEDKDTKYFAAKHSRGKVNVLPFVTILEPEMFSHETEKNVMIGTGIALEYTRDSPLFRQQLNAIEESYNGISGYVDGFDLN